MHQRMLVPVAILALALAGCAATSSTPESPEEATAQQQVANLARTISAERPDDIDGWARAAVAEADSPTSGEFSGVQLIGIDELQSESVAEPFGSLDFRVSAPASTEEQFCFRVVFDYYGKVGEWSTSEGVDAFDCPDDAQVVVPPVDTRIVEVVAANTREVIHAVLLQRAQTALPAGEDDIAAAIAARLEPPTGEYTAAAPPYVLVEPGGRVGVAVGSASDCVLVKGDGAAVEDLYVPSVLLQPGELGCAPSTALADPELLRPPH
jgi:hypothetical protein